MWCWLAVSNTAGVVLVSSTCVVVVSNREYCMCGGG